MADTKLIGCIRNVYQFSQQISKIPDVNVLQLIIKSTQCVFFISNCQVLVFYPFLNISDTTDYMYSLHRRPCNPPLVACTTTGRLQSSGHGVSSTELSVSGSPPYLDQLARIANRHRLRSSSSHRLQVPAYLLAIVGRRSFPVAASILRNNLPPDIQSSSSLTDFSHKPKTYLFHHSAVTIHVSTSVSWTL